MHCLDFAFFGHFDGFFIGDIYLDRTFRLDFFSVCPDRDVKKACFRNALIHGRFCALEIGLVFR